MNTSLKNGIVTVCGIGLLLVYLLVVAGAMPGGLARTAITLLLLAVIGAVSGFVMRGGIFLKFALVVLLPLAQFSVEGVDDAKIGLFFLVLAIELIVLWIGVFIGHLFQRARPTPS